MSNARTTERHLLHFHVSPQPETDSGLIFYSGLSPHRVHAHTAGTLAEARVGNPLLQQLPDAYFSHYVEVDLPADQVVMTRLVRPIEVNGAAAERFVSLALHLPRESRRRCAAHAGVLSEQAGMRHPKLNWLLRHGDRASVERALAPLDPGDLEADFLHDLIDGFETASSLLYQHPGLINLGAESGAPVWILRDCIGTALDRRDRIVDAIEDLGERWSECVPLLDDDGEPITDEEGPVFTAELHPRVRSLMTEPLSLALRYATQLEVLRNQTWRVHDGSTTDEHDALQAAAAVAQREALGASGTRWTLQALTRMNGVRTHRDIEFDPQREGGWAISGTWSSEDTPSLDAAIVSALSEGRMFARVDAVGRQGAWVGTFAAQTLREDEAARFGARFESATEGSDYAAVVATLDALRTDLDVEVTLLTRSSTAELASVHLGIREPDGSERIVWSAHAPARGAYGRLRVRVTNEWLRYLGAYVEFYDANDRPIEPPDWASPLPGALASLFDRHPTRRYLDVLGPIDTVFGIPLPALPSTLDIPVPAGAASVKLYWGGLGTGVFDNTVCPCGITCTAVMNLALPVILLLGGSSEKDSSFINNLMKDKHVRYGIYAVGVALAATGSGVYIGYSQDPGRAARTVAAVIGQKLAKKVLRRLAEYIARKLGEGAAKRAIPFINLAFLALDAAVTLAQLAQTTAAILQSPFYYVTRLTRTFDLALTIRPDPRFGRFPDHRDLMRVQLVYDVGNSLPLSEIRLPRTPMSEPIPLRFNDLAAGGRFQVLVFFYADNGWQSAMGASGWLDAEGDDGSAVRTLDMVVRNELIPLSKDSVYEHNFALGYEGGRYRWQQRPAPTTTLGNRQGLLSLVGITVAQRPGMLAYAWHATGLKLPRDGQGAPSDAPLYAMQNISLREDPQSRHALAPAGFTLQCGVAYDVGSDDDGSGANFYLDPSGGEFHAENNLAGGFHLRRIELSSGTTPRFTPGAARSWGRFPTAVDRFVVHPQGYVAGVSASQSKLYLLELPDAPIDNRHAPMASPYSGHGAADHSGPARAGLLARPCAIAVALDGRLLVLEDGNKRIQSFDLSGNPVPYFNQPGSTQKTALLPLRDAGSSMTCLDLSVEARGYLFVLVRTGSGTDPDHYRVDIYEPDGAFLVSTPRVAAERIAVDLARALYTLNWETLSGPDARTEPSVSQWLAPPPSPAHDAEQR